MSAPLTLRGYLDAGGVRARTFDSLVKAAFQNCTVQTTREVYISTLDKTPVSDQGPVGSCVANAVCDGLELCRAQEGKVEQLSRLGLYWFSRALHGGQWEDGGTHFWAALKQASTMGVLPESSWPYDPSKAGVEPPNKLIVLASDNRVGGYYAIDAEARCDIIELCLRADQPVGFAAQLSKADYKNPHPDAVIGPPKDDWGWHAQLVVGMRVMADGTRHFRVRNSWGEDWGDGGYIWISEEYLGSPQYVTEAFSLTRMKELVL